MTDKFPPSAESQCLEYIHEMLGMMTLSCEVAQKYCELGDRHGLEYQLRRLQLHQRAAIDTFKELREIMNLKELEETKDESTRKPGSRRASNRQPAPQPRRNP